MEAAAEADHVAQEGGPSTPHVRQLNLESIPEPLSAEGSDVAQSQEQGTPRSCPPSPAEWMIATPSGTPSSSARYRPTLSLVDMIDSPSVEVHEHMDMVWQQAMFQ